MITNYFQLHFHILRNKDDFLLENFTAQNNERYRLVVTNISLFIKQITLTDSLALFMEESIRKEPFRIPFVRTQTKAVYLNEGQTVINFPV